MSPIPTLRTGPTPATRPAAIAIALAALLGLAAPLQAAPSESGDADAEEASISERNFQKILQQGKDAYNARKYQDARGHFIEAIQMRPDQPMLYRNLARTSYWMKAYPSAVHYYDVFLQMVDDDTQTKRAVAERRSAAERAGDQVWTLPDDQRRILEALRKQLNEGAAYTEGGGGAWALYRALLRSGYAQPELARLQKRLRQKLLEEFEANLAPASGQPTPKMTLQDWKRQRARLEAARKLSHGEAAGETIDAKTLIVDAAVAMLNSRWGEAADRAVRAISANPHHPFLRWYQVSALVHAERYAQAASALEDLRSAIAGRSPQLKDYLKVMEGIVAQRRGDAGSAAETYSEMLD